MKKRSGNKAHAGPGHKEKPAVLSQPPRTDGAKGHPAGTARKVLRKVPAAGPKDTFPTPPSPKQENMEVHHHHHSHAKSSWKHYGFEFFMLFLAVFCGFLAEWQLEHAIERQREKQFIRSLAEDLKRDTAEAAAYIAFNETTRRYCDSLQACLTRPDLLQNSNAFYDYSRELARLARYNPTDRTMQQLKNAGNMRLIRKWHVSNAITAYDSQTRLLSELDGQLNAQKTKYRDHLIQFLDLSAYDRLNAPDSYMESYMQTKGNPGFIAMDESKAKLLYNEAFTVRIFSDLLIRSAAGVKQEAGELLEVLRAEYGVE